METEKRETNPLQLGPNTQSWLGLGFAFVGSGSPLPGSVPWSLLESATGMLNAVRGRVPTTNPPGAEPPG